MQQYDYMLGELKKLRNKITNKELNKKLSFMEIVWNRRLYQELGDEAGKLDNTLKKRGSNTKESIMYCLSTIFSGGVHFWFVIALFFNLSGVYFKISGLLTNFCARFQYNRKYRCPCCNKRVGRFLDFNYSSWKYNSCLYPGYEKNTICPHCQSLPRHRMIAYYFNRRIEELQNKKILIFGMRSAEHTWLDRWHIAYKCADPYDSGADFKYDIQNIACGDKTYDVVICNHVLEHVENYQKALGEVFRILREDGLLILTVPTLYRYADTFEKERAETEMERILHYGQNDHLRIFGANFDRYVKNAGFSVEKITGESLPRKIRAVRGPAEYDDNVIYLCRRNKAE